MERLDKLLASQGTWSRKDVKSLISKGLVSVNGAQEKKADRKVEETDIIAIDGKQLNVQKYLYLMMNKPPGYVSAVRDSLDKTVLELVPAEYKRKNLFPAGRLDKDTTGMIIITDDGAMAHDILSPKNHVPKSYIVTIDIPLTPVMSERFAAGIELNDGICRPAVLEILCSTTGKVTLEEGRYHQIKRMFGCCGAKVTALKRVSMGALQLDGTLPEGQCRPLTEDELILLQRKCYN
ncbi:pseudouridine synthase [Parasporobacterium paucivorans]|uniref:Ribosomal small subunit pseudouridine synthase A n=1 Tax=Parasporobacterium paucivorans DSM 15970 TaxID=1122934 RepID=A0A1M6JJN2_9FIRM|nr:16S rRNA pseudouridine(516) synthase [Parasporobacterium paucivorans]SHJ46941.1 ribosomal small subunit pseudouridine synthase A [Parasporobacterium paucivorans DSM 15970]